jgi:glycosyltransferase involved in cell wall biosynthesis
VVVSQQEELYVGDRRRIGPPLRFGAGVLRHLARNRSYYDAVHLCSFPYFSLLGARVALAGTEVPIGVDWFEVWSRDYWDDYLGRVGGAIGDLVQRFCVRLTPTAYAFSDAHRRRLADQGLARPSIRLGGLYSGPLEPHPHHGERTPLVVFAGRHIPEKQAELVPAAVAGARGLVPGLRGLILGDGPRRAAVLGAIAAAGAAEFVEAPGFVSASDVEDALGRATCHVLPSRREGYGLVVIEAAALGTPSVVLAGEDNAAVELIEEGVNGYVAGSEEGLAQAIAVAHESGEQLRRSTAQWFADHASDLSASASARTILGRLDGSRNQPDSARS